MLTSRYAQLRTSLVFCLLAAACSCNPESSDGRLVIESPKNGTTLNRADDVLPNVDGIQIEVVVSATGLDGRAVKLEGTAGTASGETIEAGKATLVLTVTQAGTLVAIATDADGVEVRSSVIGLAVDQRARACRIVSPADGSTLDDNDDALPAEGFQHGVQVRCAGVETGNPLTLAVNGNRWAELPLGAGGLVLFPSVELLEGENVLHASVRADDGEEVTTTAMVTVATGRCKVVVSPASGTVFNARGEGGAVADLEPGSPMDAVLTVETDCKEGEIEIRRGSVPVARGAVGARVEFPVQLIDGAAEVRAFVVSKGVDRGVSPLVRYLVDSVVPSASLTFPTAGQAFSDSFDRSDEPGLQISVRGVFEGIDPSSTFQVVLKTDDDAPEVIDGIVGSDGSFDVLVTLPDGSHELFVRATRASGTTAKSDVVRFTSRFQNALFVIDSPVDGTKLPLASDADPAAEGFQVSFHLKGSNLAGRAGTLNCSGQKTAFTLDESGEANVLATIEVEACEGSHIRCSAQLVSNGVTFDTPGVDVYVDPTPPEILLISPHNDVTLASALLNIAATTSCPGEEQTFSVFNGATLIHGPAPVLRNAIEAGPLPLPPGASQLALRVTDRAGNVSEAPFRVFVDDDAPRPVFLTPSPESPVTLRAADDADADLQNGFQHSISVEVANEALGTLVEIYVDNRAPIPALTALDAEGRHVASFNAVTFPEGAFELKACATDEAGSIGCQTIEVVVDTDRPVCNVETPNDGRTLGARDDTDPEQPGIQPAISVTTTAAENTFVSIHVEDPSGASFTASAAVNGGVARLSSASFLEEGRYVVTATCPNDGGLAGQSLPNTVQVAFAAPAVAIVEPVDGTVFNAQSPDRGAADGFQIDLRVRSPQAAPGAVVHLTTDCGSGAKSSPPAHINSLHEATFRAIDVPNVGECTFSVVLEDAAGNRSDAATSTVTIDREPPVVTITYPQDGDIFGKNQDADPQTPQFELQRIEASVSGAQKEAIRLRVGTTLMEGGAVTDSGPMLSATWPLVPLAEGPNEIVVSATDPAGNVTRERVVVTVNTLAPVVTITNILNNRILGARNDSDPDTPGLQYGIQVGGERLGNGTTIRICSAQAAPTAPGCVNGGRVLGSSVLSGGNTIVPNVTLPEGDIEIYAEAVDLAENVARSASVSVYVDSLAPVVDSLFLEKRDGTPLVAPGTTNRLLGPDDDSTPGTPGFQARLSVKISDGDAVPSGYLRFVDSNPLPNTPLGPDIPVAADGTATLNVTLVDGGHRIHVLAVDKAGNASTTPDDPDATLLMLHFAVQLSAPPIVITSPRTGTLLARHDADPTLEGLQYDVVVESDADPGSDVELLLDDAVLATKPLIGQRVSMRVTLPEGAHVLSARATGLAGNVGTSLPVSVFVDSVAPVVSITQPTNGASISTDADPSADGFQISVSLNHSDVEVDRPIELFSSIDGLLATAYTNEGGTVVFPPLTVSSGHHALTARVSDVSGNETTSAQVSIDVDTSAPSVWFVSPDNPLLFGLSTQQTDGFCHVTIEAKTDADEVTFALLENGVVGREASAASRAATFDDVTIKPGVSTTLQLRATDADSKVGYSTIREARCDLTAPTVAFVDPPPPSMTYVAYGNPGNVREGRIDLLPSPSLEADFTLAVANAQGALVEFVSDLDGLLVSRTVSSDGQTLFSTVSIPSGGTHELTARVTTASGNTSEAKLTAYVDVQAPAAALPDATVLDWRNGRVKLTFPAPGSDGATGDAVAGYLVRVSDAPIGALNAWAAAATVTPSDVVIAAPGATQEIVLDGLALERQHYVAVRAFDAVGNLGPLGGSPAADLRLNRTHAPLWASDGVPTAVIHTKLLIADLNGDGFDDIIVSNAQRDGNKGQVQIFYGGPTQGPAVVLQPAATKLFGASLAVGDVNGDGHPDLLVGAQYETTGLTLDEHGQPVADAQDGAVHVYFGSANTKLSTGQISDAVIQGQVAAGDPTKGLFGFGFSVAVVDDLTGDGINDVVIGAPGANGMAGRVFVIAGRATWPAKLPAVANARAILRTNFTSISGPWFGHQIVSLGDVNNDGQGDFAIGAPGGGLNEAQQGLRPVYVVSGALAVGEIAVDTIAHAVYPNPESQAYALQNQFGAGLVVGDFTGDGRRDLGVLDGILNRFFIYGGAELTVPEAAGGTLVDASSSRLVKSDIPKDLGTGTATLSAWRDVNGDGIDEISASFQKINAAWGFFGRSATEWRSLMVKPDNVTVKPSVVLRRRTSDTLADFGVRSGAGHILSTDGPRDIAVMSMGGGIMVLSDP